MPIASRSSYCVCFSFSRVPFHIAHSGFIRQNTVVSHTLNSSLFRWKSRYKRCIIKNLRSPGSNLMFFYGLACDTLIRRIVIIENIKKRDYSVIHRLCERIKSEKIGIRYCYSIHLSHYLENATFNRCNKFAVKVCLRKLDSIRSLCFLWCYNSFSLIDSY